MALTPAQPLPPSQPESQSQPQPESQPRPLLQRANSTAQEQPLDDWLQAWQKRIELWDEYYHCCGGW